MKEEDIKSMGQILDSALGRESNEVLVRNIVSSISLEIELALFVCIFLEELEKRFPRKKYRLFWGEGSSFRKVFVALKLKNHIPRFPVNSLRQLSQDYSLNLVSNSETRTPIREGHLSLSSVVLDFSKTFCFDDRIRELAGMEQRAQTDSGEEAKPSPVNVASDESLEIDKEIHAELSRIDDKNEEVANRSADEIPLHSPKNKQRITPPDGKNAQEYLRMCLEPAFVAGDEERTFRSDPVFSEILNPLNARNYAGAIREAKRILPRFDDFDLVYSWLASAYRQSGDLEMSRSVLMDGLENAKGKQYLLTPMGETESEAGKIHEAVFWWCQALHCADDDHKAFLFLAYVAAGCGLSDVKEAFLARADRIHTGELRFDYATSSRLNSLVLSQASQVLVDVLSKAKLKYGV